MLRLSGSGLIVAETNWLFNTLFQISQLCDFHFFMRQRMFEMLSARGQGREDHRTEGRGL